MSMGRGGSAPSVKAPLTRAVTFSAPKAGLPGDQRVFRSVIYTSSATTGVTVRDLHDILAASRRNNAGWHLSGVLLFEGGTFLQVVEGPAWPLQKALTRIEADPRHTKMDVLCDMRTERRYFPDWAMGSREIDGEAAFRLDEAELTARLAPDTPPVVRVMLKTFFRVNARYAAAA